MRLRFVGMVCAGLALALLGTGVAQSQGQPKDKDGLTQPKKDPPRDEKGRFVGKDKTVAEVAGKIKSVAPKTGHFTVAPDTKGKDQTFQVTDKTKFIGPKGGDRGVGLDGLKDDCMAPGYEVRVVHANNGKDALEVHLPNRK